MKSGKIKIIDLSHVIDEDMPVYPGSDKPKLERLFTVEANGFAEMKISMFTHTGTHMDAPAHMRADGKTLDGYPPNKYMGLGFVFNAAGRTGSLITREDLLESEEEILSSEYLLINTGWDVFWGKDPYFDRFPVLTSEASHWLASAGLKGIGIDAVSVDPVGGESMENHNILLSAGMVIVENLTNLEQLPGTDFIFQCLPLPFKDADGSPVRAVGII